MALALLLQLAHQSGSLKFLAVAHRDHTLVLRQLRDRPVLDLLGKLVAFSRPKIVLLTKVLRRTRSLLVELMGMIRTLVAGEGRLLLTNQNWLSVTSHSWPFLTTSHSWFLEVAHSWSLEVVHSWSLEAS